MTGEQWAGDWGHQDERNKALNEDNEKQGNVSQVAKPQQGMQHICTFPLLMTAVSAKTEWN